jgi:signal transduction histidine kinase
VNANVLTVKILLVDDRYENLLALESLLKEDGTEIFKAYSGREALELLLLHDFGLVILDVQMPEINGFELAELMRGIDRTKKIPIIFVTAGSSDPKLTFRGYESGAVEFLYKPLNARIVQGKVNVFKQLERQRLLIQSQMTQLTNALKTRDEFFSIISHELKTPLTSLMLNIQLAQRSLASSVDPALSAEKVRRRLDLSVIQSEKLAHLIDELLDIARIHTGKLSTHLIDANLAQVIRDVTTRFCDTLEQASCPVTLHLDDTLIVPADTFRVEQVLINLLTNAMRYAPGSPIEISLNRQGNRAALRVKDHGPGIPELALASLFEPFERGPNADSKTRGLGLGLYIVRQIMLAHNGDITIKSEPNEGAEFTAAFPLQPPTTAAA